MSIKQNIKQSMKRALWLVPVTLLILLPVSHFFTKRSDVYKTTVEQIKSNNQIAARLGEVSDISLSPFNYRVSRYGDDRGKAQFTLMVDGAVNSAKIKAYMEKQAGVWKLIDYKMSDVKNSDI